MDDLHNTQPAVDVLFISQHSDLHRGSVEICRRGMSRQTDVMQREAEDGEVEKLSGPCPPYAYTRLHALDGFTGGTCAVGLTITPRVEACAAYVSCV
jgi:hypothetical protein